MGGNIRIYGYTFSDLIDFLADETDEIYKVGYLR
jgi:hypothetical protein